MSFFLSATYGDITDAWMMINLGVILPRVIHELRLPFSITRIEWIDRVLNTAHLVYEFL